MCRTRTADVCLRATPGDVCIQHGARGAAANNTAALGNCACSRKSGCNSTCRATVRPRCGILACSAVDNAACKPMCCIPVCCRAGHSRRAGCSMRAGYIRRAGGTCGAWVMPTVWTMVRGVLASSPPQLSVLLIALAPSKRVAMAVFVRTLDCVFTVTPVRSASAASADLAIHADPAIHAAVPTACDGRASYKHPTLLGMWAGPRISPAFRTAGFRTADVAPAIAALVVATAAAPVCRRRARHGCICTLCVPLLPHSRWCSSPYLPYLLHLRCPRCLLCPLRLQTRECRSDDDGLARPARPWPIPHAHASRASFSRVPSTGERRQYECNTKWTDRGVAEFTRVYYSTSARVSTSRGSLPSVGAHNIKCTPCTTW